MKDRNGMNDRNYKNDRKQQKEDMRDRGERLESFLATLGRSAAPEGLKERLLRSVEKRKPRERAMTPGMLKIIAASLTFAAIFWGSDFLITRAEKKHLAALFNLNAISQVNEDMDSLWLENQTLTDSERLFFFSTGFRYPRPKKEGWKPRVYLKLSDIEEELNGT